MLRDVVNSQTLALVVSNLIEKVPPFLRTGIAATLLALFMFLLFTAKTETGVEPRETLFVFPAWLRVGAPLFSIFVCLYVWTRLFSVEIWSPFITSIYPEALIPDEKAEVFGDNLCSICLPGDYNIFIGGRHVGADRILSADPTRISFRVPSLATAGPLRVDRSNPIPLLRTHKCEFPAKVSAVREGDVSIRLESASRKKDGSIAVPFSIFNRGSTAPITITDLNLLVLRAGPGASILDASRLDLGIFELTSDHFSGVKRLEPLLPLKDRVIKIDVGESEFVQFFLEPPKHPHSASLRFGLSAIYYTSEGSLGTVRSDRSLEITSDQVQGFQVKSEFAQ